MRQYELTVIFPLEEDLYNAGRELVLADLAHHGAQIEKTEEMGDKDLAYPINKKTRGRYTLYTIKLDPAQLVALERAFKLNNNIIRHLFVKVEE